MVRSLTCRFGSRQLEIGVRAQGTARTKGLARIEKATFPARQSRRLTSGGKAVRKSFLEKEELVNLLRRDRRGRMRDAEIAEVA